MATDELTPRPAETRTRAVTVVLIAFISGIVIGVAADHAFLLYHRRILPSHGARPGTRMLLEHMSRELDLTPQQRTAVSGILERHRTSIEAIWSDVRPRVRREIDAGNAEIEKLLTPEQRPKYEKMKMRIQQRHGHGEFLPPPPR